MPPSYLPPIPDIIEEEEEGCDMEMSNNSCRSGDINRNHVKSNSLIIAELQRGKEYVTFESVLPINCSKQTAALAFMNSLGEKWGVCIDNSLYWVYIIGLIQKGIVRSQQLMPYDNIVFTKGDNF